MAPLVSIVVLCHNREDLIGRTLASVLGQRFADVEVVVVDDGSTDGTADVVRSFEGVRYVYQDSQGITAARTRAAKQARGRWIAFQDDDDLMPEGRIVQLLEALEPHPDAVFAMGDYATIDADDQPTGRRSDFAAVRGSQGPTVVRDPAAAILTGRLSPLPHTTLFRRDVAETIGWFDHRFVRSCEDLDFFTRMSLRGKVVYVPEIMSWWRVIEGRESLSGKSVYRPYGRVQLLEKHLAAGTLGEEDIDQARALLYGALRAIDNYRQLGVELPDDVDVDTLARARRQLDPVRRFRCALHPLEMPITRALRPA